MENLIGVLVSILIFGLAIWLLSKSTTPKVKVETNTTSNNVDEHLETCKKNAEIREQKAQKEFDKLRAKNNETRKKTNKTDVLIELNKTQGKSEAQKEEELAEAIRSGYIYKS